MSNESATKINKLITQWTMGTPSTKSFLIDSGFDPNLLWRYRSSHWLEPFGRGAYKRVGDEVNWLGALYTLQTQLKLPVHAGGKTALELKGYAHYLPAKQGRIYLYGPRGLIIPLWFNEERLDVEILVTRTNLFPADCSDGFTEFKEKGFFIRISAPERAMMEMLHLVPKHAGFSESRLIMENLASLRPDLVQVLLEQCRSIKVKRMFLYMADKCGHNWLPALDLSKIDLGSGSRVIVPNGRYDAKYRITVPAESETMA